MTRQPSSHLPVGLAGALVLGLLTAAHAQKPTPSDQGRSTQVLRPDQVVRQALQANPVTAPYPILTSLANGQVVLSGRVGTKQIHDVAIRTVIALGYPVRDDLVIDTGESHRVAAAAALAPAMQPVAGIPSLGVPPYAGVSPYIYPPPLFGRLDEPFFGFEPPLLSYPPWWGAVLGREPINTANVQPPAGPVAPAGAAPDSTASPSTGAGAGTPVSIPLGPTPQDGTVEMTLDPRGFAVLRGTVPTLADRVAIGQALAQTPGIGEVLNLLAVKEKGTTPPAGAPPSETPPPPPQPALPPNPRAPAPQAPAPPVARDAPAPGGRPAVTVDAEGGLGRRLSDVFARRPALAELPIKVTVRDGIAELSGRTPTAYEAMLAFRAVQQTPGVREVVDRLEFVVPDGEGRNPLIEKGRPDDVEAYLTAQLRRQVGDLAHVDQLRLRGDTLEVRGTIARADDRPRLDAILRSIPLLRGFRLEPVFVAE